MTIFGADNKARLYVPMGSAYWNVDGVAEKEEYDNVLLLSYSLSDQEVVDIKRCFDETTHIYAFGRNTPSCILEVNLLVLLKSACQDERSRGRWADMLDLHERYEKARVYKKLAPVDVTIDDVVISGYLVRMTIGDVDPRTKISVVSLIFIRDEGI